MIQITLLIAIKDAFFSEETIKQVNYFNYQCIICKSLEEVHFMADPARAPHKIGAVLLDTALCLAHDPKEIQALTHHLPLIFISTDQSVKTRLFAAKADAKAYSVYPFEFTNLIEKIDQAVTPSHEATPYRILIIEDSKTQASIIHKHLEAGGMITAILMDPFKIEEVLTEFQPDLILLDLYMPACSGTDLAKVIRQQDRFVSIPIVYFSSEEDINKKLSAIEGGGDDFLTKPISPHHLVAAISARAQRSRAQRSRAQRSRALRSRALRSRALRSEMILDSLTGLLNHTRLLEQLNLEITRAHHLKTTLCFVMIDIDHFKNINDTHEHLAGDNVIKNLARLLKQALRKSDSIGRYGGEEFAIILPQTTTALVYEKLDALRHTFSLIQHHGKNSSTEFSAAFSAGLAALSPENDTADKLVQAADEALYTAKKQGRNKIILFS